MAEVAEVADAPDTAPASGGNVYKIPIKGGGSIDVSTGDIPDNVYAVAFQLGMKDLLSRGLTKITTKGLEGDELEKAKAAIVAKVNENYANLKEGKLPRMAGVKSDSGKIPGVVMTEARRLARNLIKDEIVKAGGKISHYKASDITAAANAYLATDEGKELVTEAKANVAKREAKVEAKGEEGAKAKLSSLKLAADPKLVAAAEKKKADAAAAKAKGGEVLSAAKAGQVKQRSKPTAPAARQ